MPNPKGDRRERELVRIFNEVGWNAFRCAGSGGGTPMPRPDIVAGNGKVRYAIEAKARSGDTVYLSGRECEDLVYVAQCFAGKARIAVRFDYQDWLFMHPGDLNVTDGGNYRVTRETAIEKGRDIDEVLMTGREVGDREGILD